MKALVSIIIPAYNCESYISKCIESVLNQSYKNIEVIIINDGSVDNTDKIIVKYQSYDSRIKYFKQDNSGPSMARNLGIEKSQGEYLVFVDSDDTVSNIYVEKLLNGVINNKFDIACCGYVDESKYGIVKLNDFWKEKYELTREELVECVCEGIGGVLWAKIFRRDIIINNNIRMNPKIFMCEDLIFILEYSQYINQAAVVSEYLYNYNRLNEKSISSNIDAEYLDNYILVIDKIKYLLKKLKINNFKINNTVIIKIQCLVNRILITESNRYLKDRDKNKFIRNVKLILENNFIIQYKYKFLVRNRIDKLINHFIKKNNYNGVLYINILIIYLRRVKDKILRRE